MSQRNRKNTVFDAEGALRIASLAVIGLSSSWRFWLQEEDRNEVVAEAVAKAWSHRESFDPLRASFQTWVGRIARNTLLDHIRKRKPQASPTTGADDSRTAKAPDTIMMEDEGVEKVLEAVSELPESYQRVIILLSEGNGPEEIAGILGCSHNAATIRCCRARKALRKILDEKA